VLAATDLRCELTDNCDKRDAAHHYKAVFAFVMFSSSPMPGPYDAGTLWCLDPPALSTPRDTDDIY
jgi:hypothetical protein